MAGSCACRIPRWNIFPSSKNKLASSAPTKSKGTYTPSFAMLCALTPAPAIALAVALYSDNQLFKHFMKAYLEA